MRRANNALFSAAVLLIAAAAPVTAQSPFPHLRLVAPAAPGGGWDQTARVIQQVLLRTGLAQTVSVENIPGAAGTIGLARFVSAEHGSGDTLMASGLIMLGAIATYRSALTLADVTPIARITGEYEILVVPSESPFRTLDDFLSAFKASPEAISWGGGSAGGTDQILAGLIADAVGVDPARVNYIAFSGGGESMSAILGGQVSVGVNGLAEFAPQIESGIVRVLAISSGERLPGFGAPTLREQGVDVELENWRSLVAPPGIGAADRARLETLVGQMVASAEWRDVLERYRWNDRYLAGPAFARFVADEEARVQAILQKLGTTRGEAVTLSNAGPYPRVVLAGLVLSMIAALAGAWRSSRRRTNAASQAEWRAVALITFAIVIDLMLIESAGFVIASAILCWLTARAFDGGHPLRDALFAVIVWVGAYVLFARLLELPLPQGVLAGWL